MKAIPFFPKVKVKSALKIEFKMSYSREHEKKKIDSFRAAGFFPNNYLGFSKFLDLIPAMVLLLH